MSEYCENAQERISDRAAVCADLCETEAESRSRRQTEFDEPICIHTDQIYDSCRDRDCVKDERVYFTAAAQEIVDNAINIKVKSAEIIWVYSSVEEVPFNRGFYSVDIKYFIRVNFDVFTGVSNPIEISGLTTFDKKVILFGSEGSAKIFQSNFDPEANISEIWAKNNLPKAIVETVDPIALSAKIINPTECCCECSCDNSSASSCVSLTSRLSVPENICRCFDGELIVDDTARRVLVTLGLFTIVKLERSVQLMIKAVDFCIPQKECCAAQESNPCDLFNTIRFPLDEFFPPARGGNSSDFSECGLNTVSCGCGCGCGCSAVVGN